MIISNLLRRTLVHYSRCSNCLTLPPPDMEARKPNWAKNIEPFYLEERFHPLTVMDPAYCTFPVLLKDRGDQTTALIREDTGEEYNRTGLVFHCLPDDCSQGQLMICNQDSNYPVIILVPRKIYDMVRPLASLSDQFDALCRYCRMSGPEQKAVEKFLTDPEAAAGLFHCMCFLSSRLIGTNTELEFLNIPMLTGTFNRMFIKRLGLEAVDPEEVHALIHSLKFSALPRSDDLYHILTFCAILNCCSSKQEYSSSIICAMSSYCECYGIRTDFLLPWCCKPDMLHIILQEALYMAQHSNSLRAFSEKLLMLCLTASIPLGEDSIEEICSQLFSGELSPLQHNWFGSILSDINGSALQTVIHRKYLQNWRYGQYLQAEATIRLHYVVKEKEKAALKLMLDSQEEADALLGAVMLTLQLRNAKELPVVLERQEEIMRKISQWLLTSNDCTYLIACKLAMALKLSCAISCKALYSDAILAKACQQFFQDKTRNAAIRLLGTFPLCCKIDCIENLELIREELEWLFRKALEEKAFPDMTLLFRACFIFRCWSEEELIVNLRKLAATEPHHCPGQSPSDDNLINQTREELFSAHFSGKNPTQEIHWDCFTGHLSQNALWRQQEMIHTAALGQPVQLRCSEDAMLALRFLRSASADQQDLAAALAEHCILAKSVSDSCLVSWFWILCCWNQKKEAMDHYLMHRSLLDRPWCTGCDHTLTLDWENFAYTNFLGTSSRLQMGIYLAALLNNCDVVNEFLHSGLLGGNNVAAVARVFHELNQCRLPKELKFLSSRDLDLTEEPHPNDVRRFILQKMLPQNLYEYWRICWDDRGITRMALSSIANFHNAAFPLGYRGEKEMVIPAIVSCPPCTHRIAPCLLRDDEVALAALSASSFPLRSLKAPILQDHEFVMDMIRRKDVYPPLDMVPEWLWDNKEFVLRSLPKKPSCYYLLSPRLKTDAQVLLAAMEGLPETDGSYACVLLRNADSILRGCKEVMIRAVDLCPDCYYMAAEHLRRDPQILALLPKGFPR